MAAPVQQIAARPLPRLPVYPPRLQPDVAKLEEAAARAAAELQSREAAYCADAAVADMLIHQLPERVRLPLKRPPGPRMPGAPPPRARIVCEPSVSLMPRRAQGTAAFELLPRTPCNVEKVVSREATPRYERFQPEHTPFAASSLVWRPTGPYPPPFSSDAGGEEPASGWQIDGRLVLDSAESEEGGRLMQWMPLLSPLTVSTMPLGRVPEGISASASRHPPPMPPAPPAALPWVVHVGDSPAAPRPPTGSPTHMLGNGSGEAADSLGEDISVVPVPFAPATSSLSPTTQVDLATRSRPLSGQLKPREALGERAALEAAASATGAQSTIDSLTMRIRAESAAEAAEARAIACAAANSVSMAPTRVGMVGGSNVPSPRLTNAAELTGSGSHVPIRRPYTPRGDGGGPVVSLRGGPAARPPALGLLQPTPSPSGSAAALHAAAPPSSPIVELGWRPHSPRRLAVGNLPQIVGRPSTALRTWARERAHEYTGLPTPSLVPPKKTRSERLVHERMQIKLNTANSYSSSNARTVGIDGDGRGGASSAQAAGHADPSHSTPVHSPRSLLGNMWPSSIMYGAYEVRGPAAMHPDSLTPRPAAVGPTMAPTPPGSGAMSARPILQSGRGLEWGGLGGSRDDSLRIDDLSPRTAALRARQVHDAVDAYARPPRWLAPSTIANY